jgi:outer membrane protein, multidrug efflux system
VSIAAVDDRLRLNARLLDNARSLAKIVAVRRREGTAAEVDERLQAVEVGRLEARRAELTQSRETLVGALAVLLGQEAPSFSLAPTALSTLVAPAIDPGQPGDLVFRRPDVLAAEARIAGANGDVRAARAAFLPSLKLSANSLGQALATSGPFGLTLSAAQSLFAPIFQGGRLRAGYAGARADQMEALAQYRQKLLDALQEGNAALAAARGSAERERALRGAAADSRRAVTLARLRYENGGGDLALVLDAERSEIAVEETLLDAQALRCTAAIDVYKALGGSPL